ncbi:unnamed protein product, partial [Prorocentrum cordatum]
MLASVFFLLLTSRGEVSDPGESGAEVCLLPAAAERRRTFLTLLLPLCSPSDALFILLLHFLPSRAPGGPPAQRL